MRKIVTVDDAKDVIAQMNEFSSHYSVTFTKIHDNESDETLAGSGTLFTCAGQYGVLTADHVLDELPDRGEFGLHFRYPGKSDQIHRFRINGANVHKITIGKASYSKDGPDLGVLLLSSPEISTLKAIKSFYNIEKHKSVVLSAPWPLENGGWFLNGFPDELTTDLPTRPGFTKIKGFHGICGAGVVRAERFAGEYDYLDYEVKYTDSYTGPQSYDGFSGGGLWQILIREVEGGLKLEKAILSGVAFYQSNIIDGLRTIFCHGRRSIYDVVLNKLVENSSG